MGAFTRQHGQTRHTTAVTVHSLNINIKYGATSLQGESTTPHHTTGLVLILLTGARLCVCLLPAY